MKEGEIGPVGKQNAAAAGRKEGRNEGRGAGKVFLSGRELETGLEGGERIEFELHKVHSSMGNWRSFHRFFTGEEFPTLVHSILQ